MKKIIIYILLAMTIISIANAIDECKSNMYIDSVPCLVMLPNNMTKVACNGIMVSFYLNSTINVYNETMSQYTNFLCNATFNQTDLGTYTFYYSNGDSGSIVLTENKDDRYYLYISAIIIFIGLVIIGFKTENIWFLVFAGMDILMTGIYLYLYGFPNLTNSFLKNGISAVLLGLGLYFILAPQLDEMEKW